MNDKTIASKHPNVSSEHYNLKLQANEFNFENRSAQQYSKTHIALISFPFGQMYLLLYLRCN